MRAIELTPDDATRVLGTVDVARLLFLAGRLAASTCAGKLEILAEKLTPKPDQQLRALIGKPVHLLGNIWEALMDADLLQDLCDTCSVSVEQDEIESARRLQTQAANVQDLVASMQRLGQRIKDGLAAKRYVFFPSKPPAEDLSRNETPAVRCLREILGLPRGGKGWVWCDDRMISRYRFCGDLPLVGIWEMLGLLRDHGALKVDEYFEKLNWLRRANARYIPVLAEEILYQLRNASLDRHDLTETPALATLRRYIASCLLDRERLHPPQGGVTNVRSLHDFTFLFELRGTVHAALREVWEDQTASTEVRAARANWIWTSLYFDVSSFRQLVVGAGADPDVVENTVTAIGALLVEGLMVKRERNQPTSPRQLYFTWLKSHIVEPFLEANSSTKTALARNVGEHVRLALTKRFLRETRLSSGVVRALLQEYIHDLPDGFAIDLGLTSREWKAVGIAFWGPTLTIGDYKVSAHEFWDAVEAALAGGEGQVKPRQMKRTLRLTKLNHPTEAFALEMCDSETNQVCTLNDPIHPLYAPDPVARLAGARRLSRWFDCNGPEREREMVRIANLIPANQRGVLLADWRQSSAEQFYRDLLANVRDHEDFSLDQLFPARWDGMLRHLRLTPDTASIDYAEIVAEWLRDEGLETALERASCLPILLPSALMTAFVSAEQTVREATVTNLANRLRSPVQQLHLIRLYGELGDLASLEKARELVRGLFAAESHAWFKAFSSLLKVVRRKLNVFGSPVRAVPAVSLFVNWYHASRIYSILAGAGVDLGAFSQHLVAAAAVWSGDTFVRMPGYWDDIAHPRNVTRANLVLNAFEAILALVPDTSRQQLEAEPVYTSLLSTTNPHWSDFAIGFITDWGFFSNALSTFIGAPGTAPMAWTDEICAVVPGQRATNVARGAEYLDAAIKGDKSQRAWTRLITLFADAPLPTELKDQFLTLATTADFEKLTDKADAGASLAVRFICKHAVEVGDPGLVGRLVTKILQLARTRAQIDGANLDFGMMLIDSLLLLSIQPNDGTSTANAFFERTQALLTAWPALAKPLAQSIGSWSLIVPVEQQGTMWRFMLQVRALG